MYCPAQVNMLIDCTLQQALFHESLQQHDYASLQDPQTCSSDAKHEPQDAQGRSLLESLVFGRLIHNSFFRSLQALCEVQLNLISCSLGLQEILALLCLPHTTQHLLHQQQMMRQKPEPR